jgi:hypothetical protein
MWGRLPRHTNQRLDLARLTSKLCIYNTVFRASLCWLEPWRAKTANSFLANKYIDGEKVSHIADQRYSQFASSHSCYTSQLLFYGCFAGADLVLAFIRLYRALHP